MKKALLCLIGTFCLVASTTFGAAANNNQAGSGMPQFTEAQKADFIRTFGWIIGQQSGVTELGLTSDQLNLLFEGLKAAANEQPPALDPSKEGMNMQQYLESLAMEHQEKMKGVLEEEAKKQAEAAKPIFEQLEADPKVSKTDSGLYYEIIKPGEGAKPTIDQLVTVNYKGMLMNGGKVFDSSYDRGEPAEFPLNGVIAGFSEGVQLIGKGGEIDLFIPADLAYGNKKQGTIPPGAPLQFKVELLDFRDKPAQPSMGNAELEELMKQLEQMNSEPEVEVTPEPMGM